MLRQLSLTIFLVFVSVGCRSPFYSDKGAVLGGLTGAGVGAIVGENEGNTAAGAAIGTAIGAAGGAIIGGGIDNSIASRTAPLPQPGVPLAQNALPNAVIQDVISMSQAGLGDPVILNYVQSRGQYAPLEPYDLIAMKQQGVSDVVIAAIQSQPLPFTEGPSVPFVGPPVIDVIPSIVIPNRRRCSPRRRPGYRKGWNVSFDL